MGSDKKISLYSRAANAIPAIALYDASVVSQSKVSFHKACA
jgi:hypothetical protein